MKYIIKVLKGRKHYYWKLVRNGKILAHSETYSSKDKARQTAKRLFYSMKSGTVNYEEGV